MAQNGNNIIVQTYNGSSWVAVAATKSDELQAEADMIEKASATQQATQQSWKEYIPGRKGWSLNVSWLVSQVADIQKVLQVGTRVQLRNCSRSNPAWNNVTGYAYVKTCKITMTRGNIATGSFSFIGDGALS